MGRDDGQRFDARRRLARAERQRSTCYDVLAGQREGEERARAYLGALQQLRHAMALLERQKDLLAALDGQPQEVVAAAPEWATYRGLRAQVGKLLMGAMGDAWHGSGEMTEGVVEVAGEWALDLAGVVEDDLPPATPGHAKTRRGGPNERQPQ